jgi:cell division protein FtsZ
MKFDIPKEEKSIIKVIGVGGGGGNAVGNMFSNGIIGVDFAVCNTDNQAMDNNPVMTKITLGPSLTEGMGAGSKPEVGKEACIESIDDVRTFLSDGTKMLFITAGMGGGTGTGAAPIIAKAAKEMGILTVGIVTLPFGFEGMRRKRNALEGLENLKKNVDAILVISNDKLREIHGDLSISDAFRNADSVLTTAAKAIAEIITVPGYINVDFEDVNYVMRDSGVALMGNGTAEGADRARKAINQALNSPLLEENDIRGAKHILLNISSGVKEVTMDEIGEITDFVQEEAGYGTDLIWGNCSDEALGDAINITLIATGFDSSGQREKEKVVEVKNVPLEDEIGEVADVDSFTIMDTNSPSANTIDFDSDDVIKTMEDLGVEHEMVSKKDPFVLKKQLEERNRRMETENARREYLRKSTTIPLNSSDALEMAEKTPAYLRRGIKLDEDEATSSTTVTGGNAVFVDEEGTIVQNGNSYLREISD